MSVALSCRTLFDPMGQDPLSMEFSRHGYWSGVPFPPLGDLPDPGIEPGSPALHADSLLSEPYFSLDVPFAASGHLPGPKWSHRVSLGPSWL